METIGTIDVVFLKNCQEKPYDATRLSQGMLSNCFNSGINIVEERNKSLTRYINNRIVKGIKLSDEEKKYYLRQSHNAEYMRAVLKAKLNSKKQK